jgi:hypothetical protein
LVVLLLVVVYGPGKHRFPQLYPRRRALTSLQADVEVQDKSQ